MGLRGHAMQAITRAGGPAEGCVTPRHNCTRCCVLLAAAGHDVTIQMAQPHELQGLNIGPNAVLRRRCRIPWHGTPTTSGSSSGNAGNEQDDDGSNDDDADSTYDAEQNARSHNTELVVRVDPTKSYDWFRFRFLEFALVIVDRIKQRIENQPAEHAAPGTSVAHDAPVVYDPVSGTCWFPMLIKAKVPHARVICSDIDPAAVQV